jgi:glycosyltransferase involved in cell wall biosynthesis
MKIAFAMINCNRRDGHARPVNEVAERLADRGHEVHLFARRVEDLDLRRIKWHKVPGPQWAEVINFWTYSQMVARLIKPGDFDIIHSIGCNAPQANVITIQTIQPAKKKILDRLKKEENVSLPRRITRSAHLNMTSKAEERMYTARKNHKLPLFLPVSQGVGNELRSYYDIGDAPVKIVPNAADLKIFHPIEVAERKAWRQQNGLGVDDVVLLFSGGEWARKGLDFALNMMAHLSYPHLKLFVAGDDPNKQRFKTMVQNLKIEDRVVFGGFRRDVAQAMASSDIFLFPSWYEAFSLATIEAAACGLPVVATSINGTEDFIEPGITGDFVPHDPKVMADVLRPLIENATLRQTMGANARKSVEASYTWDKVADMTEAAYKEYLGLP